jgi:hypothetical protein
MPSVPEGNPQRQPDIANEEMHMRSRATSGLAVLFTLSISACGGEPAVDAQPANGPGDSAAAACNRYCLIGHTRTYLAADVAGYTSAAPIATDNPIVENVTRRQPAEGLWANAT